MENNNSDRINQQLSATREDYPPDIGFQLRLNSIENTRRSLAKIIREFARGRVQYQQYRALIYGLSSLLAYHKAIDLDARLEALEKQLEALK